MANKQSSSKQVATSSSSAGGASVASTAAIMHYYYSSDGDYAAMMLQQDPAWLMATPIDDDDLAFGGKPLSAWYEEDRRRFSLGDESSRTESDEEESRGRQRVRAHYDAHRHPIGTARPKAAKSTTRASTRDARPVPARRLREVAAADDATTPRPSGRTSLDGPKSPGGRRRSTADLPRQMTGSGLWVATPAITT